MSVQIKAVGIVKTYIGGKSQVAMDAGRTVRELLQMLSIPIDIVALVMVNDAQQSKDYVTQEGDVVTLLAVVGGG